MAAGSRAHLPLHHIDAIIDYRARTHASHPCERPAGTQVLGSPSNADSISTAGESSFHPPKQGPWRDVYVLLALPSRASATAASAPHFVHKWSFLSRAELGF